MRKIIWKQYREGDLEGLTISSREKTFVEKKIQPPAFTAYCEGRKIACTGITLLWGGVGEAWIVVSRNARKYIALPGSVRWLLDKVQKKMKLRRVQATVRVDNPQGRRLARWLGFEDEGVLLGYAADGMACWILARVR